MNALDLVRAELERGPSWLALLLDAGLKATVLLGAAALVNFAFRKAPASARHVVWATAVVSAVLLPVLGAVLPSWQVPILPAQAVKQAPVALAELAELPMHAPRRLVSYGPTTTRTAPMVAPVSLSGARSAESKAQLAVAEGSTSLTLNGAAPSMGGTPPSPTPLPWATRLAILWVLGTFVFLARILAGRIGVWRVARAAEPVTRHGMLALAARLAKQLGIRREVLLVQSESVSLPMTWGINRPVVLIPRDADGWTLERLELVLLHELAHVKRLDALTQLLAQLCCALYWFHPLTWFAERKLRALREYACDDQVLEAGNRPSEYAGQILEIVRSLGRRDRLASATLAMARRSQLEGRLVAILNPHLPRAAFGRKGTSAVTVAFLALLIPLAALHPGVADAQTPSAKGPLPRLSPGEAARRQQEPVTSPSAIPESAGSPAAAPEAASPVATAGGELCRAKGRSSTSISSHRNGSKVWRAVREGQGCRLELQTEGEVAVNRDGVELSEGGYFSAAEQTDGHNRRFEVRKSRSGKSTQSWTVDGAERPVDADARAFVSAMLDELGSANAPVAPIPPAAPVVARAPQAPVPPALADSWETPPAPPAAPAPPAPSAPMIAPTPPTPPTPAPEGWSKWSRESGDDSAGYQAMLEQAKADEQQARDALTRAMERAHSDDELVENLEQVADEYKLAGENTRQLYLVLAGKLRSDDALADVLDYFHRIKEHPLAHGPLAMDYVQAASHLRSDDALADALQNELHPSAPRDAALAALQLARRIHDDDARHKVLIEIKDHQQLDDALIGAYTAAAQEMRDAEEREAAMTELADAREEGPGGRRMRIALAPNVTIDVGPRAERARARAEAARERAEALAESARERAEAQAEAARDRAEALREQAQERAQALRDQGDDLQKARAREQVQRFKAESERMKDEAKRLKAQAKRLAEEMKQQAKQLKQQLSDKLDDEGLDEEIDSAVEDVQDELDNL